MYFGMLFLKHFFSIGYYLVLLLFILYQLALSFMASSPASAHTQSSSSSFAFRYPSRPTSSSSSSSTKQRHSRHQQPHPQTAPTEFIPTLRNEQRVSLEPTFDHHYETTVAALFPNGRVQLMKLCWCNFGTALRTPPETCFDVYTVPHDTLYRIHVARFSSKQWELLPPAHPMREPSGAALSLFANNHTSAPAPDMIYGICFITRSDEADMDTTQVQQLFK